MTSASKSSTTSEFYYACRNGLIDQVREQLPNMSLEEINQVQANGSTALHAACYFNHPEIVELLLEKGASRSIPNNHKCLPYDEAENVEIKKLFIRRSNTRFSDDGSGHIDWMKCDAAAEKIASDYRFRHSGGFGWNNKNIDHRINHIKEEMPHAEVEDISLFLDRAKTDPYFLLKAYTVESEFYRRLNKDLATRHFNQGTNFGITYFIDFFYNNPAFDKLSFKGKVYRGMCITDDDLKQYSVGGKVMNKAFMSTAKIRAAAEEFTKGAGNREKKHGGLVKLSALCTYEIINPRTGLDIERISEYSMEKEVLVGPYSAFKIIAIRPVAPDYVEIDLRECEQVNDKDDDDDDDDDD